MQPIDSIETRVYETRKDLVNKKEGIKYSNIVEPYQNDSLCLMMLQKKMQGKTIETGLKLLIIYREY